MEKLLFFSWGPDILFVCWILISLTSLVICLFRLSFVVSRSCISLAKCFVLIGLSFSNCCASFNTFYILKTAIGQLVTRFQVEADLWLVEDKIISTKMGSWGGRRWAAVSCWGPEKEHVTARGLWVRLSSKICLVSPWPLRSHAYHNPQTEPMLSLLRSPCIPT